MPRSIAVFALGLVCSCPALALPCTDADADGFFREAGCGTATDCNDADPGVRPGAFEACDGRDGDCDGAVDDDPGCARACDLSERIVGDVLVSSPGTQAYHPSLTWTGSEYGVAWVEGLTGNEEIFAVRLDASGTKLSAGVRVTQALGRSVTPWITWNGSEYALVWSDERDGNPEIYFARLDASGAKIGSEIRLTNHPEPSFQPRIVWSGSEYGVVWWDFQGAGAGIYFAIVDRSGVKQGTEARVDGLAGNMSQSSFAALAWSGSEYGIAWSDDRRRNGNYEIYFTRLGPTGTKLIADVALTDAAMISFAPSLVWADGAYGVAWWDNRSGTREVWFTRASAAGAEIGSDVRVALAYSEMPVLAWTGLEYGVAWDGRPRPDQVHPDIYVTRLGATGSALASDITITDTVLTSSGHAMAWTGLEYGLVWTEDPDGSVDYEVRFARVGCGCVDGDGDAVTGCNDCDDTDPAVRPGAAEICNGRDDDCDGLADEDGLGLDADGDGVSGACDNCQAVPNASQVDTDADGRGNVCDNCASSPNFDQSDTDADGRGNVCDNCPADANPAQEDLDGDGAGDACDNCLVDANAAQSDRDGDFEGDMCDLDDGTIYLLGTERDYSVWQDEAGFSSWNSYKGDLAVLRATGVYTQEPGSSVLARRDCGLVTPWVDDFDEPPPGRAAHFLVTGVIGGVESDLGTDSAGRPRPNGAPCP